MAEVYVCASTGLLNIDPTHFFYIFYK